MYQRTKNNYRILGIKKYNFKFGELKNNTLILWIRNIF